MSVHWIVSAISFSALVPALLLHEVAHGWAALLCGDPTAKEEGRLSLNPLRHVDPFMSVVLPAILALTGSRVLFGGAKPVPIDLRRCRNPRRAYWMIAAAGPLCNFAQALVGAGALRALAAGVEAAASGAGGLWGVFGTAHAVRDPFFGEIAIRFSEAAWVQWVELWLLCYCSTNVALMVFNLLPVPPLDGSRIVTVLLRGRAQRLYAGLERHGLLLIFALLYFPQTGRFLSRAVSAVLSLLGIGFD